MSGDVVARAKDAIEDVTGGSWTAQEFVQGKHCNLAFETFVDTDGYNSTRCLSLPKSKSDAEFIAAARSLVPELVAEVEKLRGAMETIQGHCIDLGRPLHHIIGDILAVIERAGIEP